MSEFTKIEVQVIIMELEKRINKLVHSNGMFRTVEWSINRWKMPAQAREIEVLREIVKKLKNGLNPSLIDQAKEEGRQEVLENSGKYGLIDPDNPPSWVDDGR
jgi:hypothetical protein